VRAGAGSGPRVAVAVLGSLAALVVLPLIILLFPDGHLPSPRWRWAVWPYSSLWIAGDVP
jgi:hypothetical protein